MRVVVLALLLTVASLSAADAPVIGVETLEPPTPTTTAIGPAVTVSPEKVAWLTWLEREGDVTKLAFSTFDAAAKKWTAATTITSGRDLYAGQADFPALSVGANGQATAVWYVKNPPSDATAHLHHGSGYTAYFSRTTDHGKTWTTAARVSAESDLTEFVSITTLADGRVLAAWLDGRLKKKGGTQQQLFSRILGAPGPDRLVDPTVCDCCQTSLTALPDGSALLAYRGKTDKDVRDVRIARFRHDTWEESRLVNSDEWTIAGCPVNGPQIASDGGRIAAAWFTGADNDPRVLATLSPDAGGRFLMPLRLTDGKTAGRVATAILHDGAVLVTYVDEAGGYWLRRISPDFVATPPVPLAAAPDGAVKGFPRMALLRDYAGGPQPAQLIVAFSREGGGLGSMLVSVPESELLEAEKTCDCGATTEQLLGFPIRGTVVAAETSTLTIRAKHFEVPGIFEAGTHNFRVTAEILAKAGEAERQFLGRVEKRDGVWWLFDVRIIASAPGK